MQYKQRLTPKSTNHDSQRSDDKPRVENDVDLLALYPNTQCALQLWSVYVQHVDPVLKILHIPSLQSVVVQTILNPGSASLSTLALTFAIYYAAITSMWEEEDTLVPPEEQAVLISRFKTALDQLLTVRHLISQPDIQCIQALAIYVVSTLYDSSHKYTQLTL